MINRIIDANSNRISESLRILEDINRFYLNKKETTLKLKNLRHLIIKHFKSYDLISFRDTQNDTAKFLNTEGEFKRKNITEIIQANCKRLQESSRVLEEVLKLNDEEGANIFKEIRFDIYDLEKEILIAIKKEFDLSLYVIIDTEFIKIEDIEKAVNDIISGGATLIQLKALNIETPLLLNISKKIRKITEKFNIPLIINSRIDIAIAAGADGIHIEKNSLQPDIIRNKFSYNKIIGYSASNEKEIEKGIKYNVDYIGLAPVIRAGGETDSIKPSALKQIYRRYIKDIPIVITGGLSPRTIRTCLENGIKNFAMTSAILVPGKIKKITSQFKNMISEKGKNK